MPDNGLKEIAGWAAGGGVSLVAVLATLSKIAKGYSSDRRSIAVNRNAEATENTSAALYELLLKENKRMDKRNQELESRNDNLADRLNKLEVNQSHLLSVEHENRQLKVDLTKKDQQLAMLLRQQRADRETYTKKFQEMTSKIDTLEATIGMRRAYQHSTQDEDNA